MAFLLLILYVSSAWWMWYYGGSFGQRVAVDFLCVFAILIAYVFDGLEKWRRQGWKKSMYKPVTVAIYGLCGVCIAWNLISMRAYWYRVLPPDGADWNTIRDIVSMIL